MYKETYDDGGVLDPENPVTLTIWHYYNGAYQAAFDKLVEEFNNSAGKDLGIYAEEMPDLFSAYTDSALGLQKDGLLTDLNQSISAYGEEIEADEESLDEIEKRLDQIHLKKKKEFVMIETWITQLVNFGLETGLVEKEDNIC